MGENILSSAGNTRANTQTGLDRQTGADRNDRKCRSDEKVLSGEGETQYPDRQTGNSKKKDNIGTTYTYTLSPIGFYPSVLAVSPVRRSEPYKSTTFHGPPAGPTGIYTGPMVLL